MTRTISLGLRAALWLVMSLCIWGAFFYAWSDPAFIGQSSRILFFHVPMAWTSFVAYFAAAVWSGRYLWGGRQPRHDRAAAAAVECGVLFGVLATVTGALWARIEWGAFWNWDPRQTSIVVVLLFYGAYLALRSAMADREIRARISSVYALIALVVTPFFYFIVPRITDSLHPEPVINAERKLDVDPRMFQVLIASALTYTILFFWIHNLRARTQALADAREDDPS
ncbi:MAG TPA: cytochrome c biogenesis protein CcsA [Thermoanaerobaculia bacterium]|nr:cytochrome c biogenesis protein CcsA [Thermoanaerobaculia bacterium]